jgi:hypothetical protein
LKLLPQVSDFYLWFYLVFAVSSTMMPSESDRHAWLPLGLWSGALFVMAMFAGVGPWMTAYIAPLIDDLIRVLTTLFGLSLAMHLVFLLPAFGLHKIIAVITRVDIR